MILRGKNNVLFNSTEEIVNNGTREHELSLGWMLKGIIYPLDGILHYTKIYKMKSHFKVFKVTSFTQTYLVTPSFKIIIFQYILIL